MDIIRVAASADGIKTIDFTNIRGFQLVGGSDAASASIFDAETQAGTAKLTIKSPANDQRSEMFGASIPFKNGLSVTLTGTGPVLYIFTD